MAIDRTLWHSMPLSCDFSRSHAACITHTLFRGKKVHTVTVVSLAQNMRGKNVNESPSMIHFSTTHNSPHDFHKFAGVEPIGPRAWQRGTICVHRISFLASNLHVSTTRRFGLFWLLLWCRCLLQVRESAIVFHCNCHRTRCL